jgi:hypothetical protein
MTNWITAYFAEAGRIARLSHVSAAFTTGWDALEDKVLARSPEQIDAILAYCADHFIDDHEAFCVITSMIPPDHATPSMADLLDA